MNNNFRYLRTPSTTSRHFGTTNTIEMNMSRATKTINFI